MKNKLSIFIEPVFSFLKTIPMGMVATYSLVAKEVGLKSPRNIGWILKQNNTPDIIPCYKVVRSNGKLAEGYKFGGKEEQQRRLENEGIRFNEKGKIINFKNLVT